MENMSVLVYDKAAATRAIFTYDFLLLKDVRSISPKNVAMKIQNSNICD